MPADANRAAIQRLFDEFYGQGTMEVADEVFAPSGVLHDATGGDMPISPDQVRQGQIAQRTTIPDLRMSLLHLAADGDLVAYHFQVSGTQITGQQIAAQGMTIARFGDDGKVAEMWRVFDQLSLMSQTGQLGQMAQGGVAHRAGPYPPQEGETIYQQGTLGKKGRWKWKVSSGGDSDSDWSSDTSSPSSD